MEDAHIAEQIDADTAVFGVFDGHGGLQSLKNFIGREVALYCEKHFV
jgi:serine/threonine protein phosphatase PrpC